MPIKFWDEVFLTATYLINHLPTRVIDNFSPLTHLFNTPPNYTMLKIFGSTCWPHLRPYNQHKLSFRSKPCIFLGYSSIHKGYKCLDQDYGRVYISRGVIFDEVVFPFSNPSFNVVDHNSPMGSSSFYWNTNHLCDLQSNPVDAARSGTDLPPSASSALADTDMGAPVASGP
jgi:hypothetical protein